MELAPTASSMTSWRKLLNESCRDAWLLTVDLDDDALEAHEQCAIHEDARREREAREERERQRANAARLSQVRFDYSGYPISDNGVRNP